MSVGTYSVQSIDFSTWFNEYNQVKAEPKPKKNNKKKIVHPMFTYFATQCNDAYWIKRFNIWSTGKLPKCFAVIDDVVIYKKSGKGHEVMEWKRTGNLLDDTMSCIEFFKTHGGLFSKKDEMEAIAIEESMTPSSDPCPVLETEDSNLPKNWAQYDKKMQELLIKNYIQQIGDQMKFNQKDRQLLLQTIRLAVVAKNFNKNNIVIKDKKIVDIVGLQWDENKIFRINLPTSRCVKKSEPSIDSETDYPKDMVTQYHQKFEKYHDMVDKKYLKYNGLNI